MIRLAVTLICAGVGFVLFRYGNRIYARMEAGENPDIRQRLAAAGLSGLSAGILLIALIGLMSFQAPDFVWTFRQEVGIVLVAVIIALIVAGLTYGKIYSFERLNHRLGGRLFAPSSPPEASPAEESPQDPE